MKTPSLTEARRALLELQEPHTYGLITGHQWSRLETILAYLDAQVPLNVENIEPRSLRDTRMLPNIPGVNDVLPTSGHFVFCTSDPTAMKPETNDRRYFVFDPMPDLSFHGFAPTPVVQVVPGSIRHDKDSRTLRCNVEFSKEALMVMTPEQKAAIRGSLTTDTSVTPTPGCGKCFKCLNGGVGKFMEHADPLKPCDGVK